MENPAINSEKIIERLKYFNYKYQLKGKQLKIFLSAGCSIKVFFYDDSCSIVTFTIGRLILDLRILLFVYVAIIMVGIGILHQNAPYNHIDKGNASLFLILGGLLIIYFFVK